MKKRIFSLILAVLMLVPVLAACKEESKPPIVNDGGSDTAGGPADSGNDTTDTSEKKETEVEIGSNGLPTIYFEDYIPNTEAVYTGMAGFGASNKGVAFDDFRVVSSDKKDIIFEEFTETTELNSLIYTAFAAPGGDWTPNLADFTVGADETDEENKQLVFANETAKGAMVLMGNSAWGPYRTSVKIKLATDTDVASLYFCVKDEKNYYELAVSASEIVLNEVKDGKATPVNTLAMPTAVGEWIPLSCNINIKDISIYVAGNEVIRVTSEPSDEALVTGKFGLGQWQTQYVIDNLKIIDAKTGEVYYENDFENAADFMSKCTYGVRNGGSYTPADGDWSVRKELDKDGNEVDNMVLACDVATGISGAMLIFGDAINIPASCEGYKITFDVMRTKGANASSEGWTIVWGYSADTNYTNYNYGGWSGCGGFQLIKDGTKTNKNMATVIGMEDYAWKTSEVHIYKDVCYSYYNGTLIQILWN